MKSRRRIVKSFVFVGLVFVFALSLVSQSGAEHKQLKGVYAVVGEATCLSHWSSSPVYFIHTASAQGTMTFNGDGSGSGQMSFVDVMHPVTNPILIPGGTSTTDVVFEFTYTVSPDGAITRTITKLDGDPTSGPNADKTFTQDPSTPLILTGFVSKDGGTILLSSVPGQAEILNYDYSYEENGAFYDTLEQKCHRSRVLTLISK